MTTNNQIQFAPFRNLADFLGQAENYIVPDFKDLARLNNRITNNLLYYQTNYLLFFLILIVLIRFVIVKTLTVKRFNLI